VAWWFSGFPCGVRHDSSAAGIGSHFVAVSLFAGKGYNLKK
jgi:metallothionein